MKLRKTIKKIVALGTGVVMMGATMFGAMAADLADYPSPLFIKDGVFDGLFVVGDNAAAEDIIGVANIAMSLQAASVVKKTVSTGTSTVTVEGDNVKIEEATNLLEMGEDLDTIRTSVTSTDLAALADGSINNEHGSFTFTQVIEVANSAAVEWTQDPDDDSEALTDYLKFDQNNMVYKYKVSFTPALKSDHKTVTGTDYLDDVRDKKIKLLGKDYTILKADHTAQYNIALTLMSGAVTDIMSEGATKTYTLSGKDYKVTPSYIGASEVLFTINSEVTDKLAETETYRLFDGVEIGVNNILAQNVAGETGGDKVEFSLGADKIKLADSATNESGGCTVTIGVDTSTNVKCEVTTSSDAGITNGDDVLIGSFEVYYNNTDDLYVPAGGSTSAVADAEEDESGVFFLNAFDITYEGISESSTEEVKIRPSGTSNYKLSFTNKAGVSYNEYAWAVSANTAGVSAQLGKKVGAAVRDLVIDETEAISKNEYFIVNKNKYSRMLQFTDVNPTDNVAKIKDLGSGSIYEVSYDASGLAGDLILDGNTYNVLLSADSSSATITVDMDGDGDKTGNASGNTLYTQNEAYITLASGTALNESFFNLTTAEDEDNNRDSVQVQFQANADGENDIQAITGPTATSLTFLSIEQGSSTYLYTDYTYALTATSAASNTAKQFGMFVEWDKKGSGAVQTDATFRVGKTATTANVFITSGAVTTGTSTSGGVETEEIQEIGVAAVKLASEVASPSDNNLLLIGGPCANSVARSVMGVTSANCAEGFEAGKAMIKLYDHAEGKVAMVVAGAGAVDTRRAALVVANYKDYASDLVGNEVVVTTVTSTPTVAQPVVAEEAATEEAAAE